MKEKIVFGFNQITAKTPQIATWFFRIVLYAVAAVNVVLQIVDEIPPEVKVIIGKYSVYAVTLTHSFTRLFGIKVEAPSWNKDSLRAS